FDELLSLFFQKDCFPPRGRVVSTPTLASSFRQVLSIFSPPRLASPKLGQSRRRKNALASQTVSPSPGAPCSRRSWTGGGAWRAASHLKMACDELLSVSGGLSSGAPENVCPRRPPAEHRREPDGGHDVRRVGVDLHAQLAVAGSGAGSRRPGRRGPAAEGVRGRRVHALPPGGPDAHEPHPRSAGLTRTGRNFLLATVENVLA